MMKVVLIGGNPKGHSIPFHPSTRSGRKLRNIIDETGLSCEIADMTENLDDKPTPDEIIKLKERYEGYQVVFLGRFVEKALRHTFPDGVYLPHPASRRTIDLTRLTKGLTELKNKCERIMIEPITLRTHFFIFEGIERDLEDYWNNEVNKHKKSKEAHWEEICEFITQYSENYRNLITEEYGLYVKKPRVKCIIQTVQEYDNFEFEHILQLLEGLGKMANMMYCAERDILIGNHVLQRRKDYPLEGRYVSALESIVWMVATFVQEGKFTDLVTRLRQLQSFSALTNKGDPQDE